MEHSLNRIEQQLEAVILVCNKLLTESEAAQCVVKNNRFIEANGIEWAMRSELEQGQVLMELSKEYLGCDFRCKGCGEFTFIGGKSFATTGEVLLPTHEWNLAQCLGQEYVFYVVKKADAKPLLHMICHPPTLRAELVTGLMASFLPD